MEEPSSIEAASFLSKSGLLKPGYQALLAVKKMQKDAADAVGKGDMGGGYKNTLYRSGEVWVRLSYDYGRGQVTVVVWTTRFPDDVYDYFLTGEASESIFDARSTEHRSHLSAKDPARIVASVNSLARKVAADREKYILLAGIRKKCANLPKGVPEKWNAESKALGLWPPSGFMDMNLKQAKVLAAWIEGKLSGLEPKAEALARRAVAILLEEGPLPEPEDETEPTISPKELTRSIGIGYDPDEFIFDWHQSRFAGYPTGHHTCYVSWKKLLCKGKPVYLGAINRVERGYNEVSPVANEGKWYIVNVPTTTRTHVPRGVRYKPNSSKPFHTRAGYGAVRFRQKPEEYTKYFDSAAQAAGYLASLILPHRHLKVVESFVDKMIQSS